MTADQARMDRAAGLSTSGRRLLEQAGKALSQGQADVAERALVSALALAPGHAEVHRLMGISLQMRGDHAKAVESLRRSVAIRPDDATTQMNLGSSLYEIGASEEALSALRLACELAPDVAATWYNLGKALKMQLRRAEALDALQRALKLDPGHLLARISLADTQLSGGDIASATANFREVLRRSPDHPDAWFALANLKTETLSDKDVAQLQRAFRKPALPPDARVSLGFALAKALEDQGNYAASFDALRDANALKRRRVSWDATRQHAHVNAIVEAFTKPLAPPLDPSLGKEVIFIASVPRSGSTLLEQILASHPQVEGADEITDLPQVIEGESKRRGMAFPLWVPSATPEDWARLGREYLDRTARWRAERPRFTDKNMLNWEHLGAALAMLPGARVVNCHRDPVETCFACYRQLFSIGSHFSYDLDDVASYYIDYARLCRFWQRHYPKHVLDYSYESMLADTEPQIRRLLDFCGLAFDPACLDFHQTSRNVLSTASAAQVRQPLRRDTSRSQHYQSQLATLRSRLAETFE
jgi:Tfp pilus assembly protein PilF